MGMRESLALDYQVPEGTQTVTFSAVRASGTTSLTINYANGHEYTLTELVALGGFFQAGDRNWALGRAEFTGGITPQRGDYLVDADTVRWELIAEPRLDDLEIAWQCPSRKAR